MIDENSAEKIAGALASSASLEEAELRLQASGIRTPDGRYELVKWVYGLTEPARGEAIRGVTRKYLTDRLSRDGKPKSVRSRLSSAGRIGAVRGMVLDYCHRNGAAVLSGERLLNAVRNCVFNRTYVKPWQLAALKSALSKGILCYAKDVASFSSF